MTKHAILILTVSLTLSACSNQTADKGQTVNYAVDSSQNTGTTAHLDSVASTDTFSIPTKSLIDIVAIFDSAGFSADTNRIKKVGYYAWTVKTSPVFVIRQIPFYKMDTTTNPIFNFLKHGTYNLHYAQVDSLLHQGQLKKIFNKVKSITGYYFTAKTTSSLQTDGFVEEWEFSNPTDAQSAETTLTKRDNSSPAYYFIYFNSFAQVFRNEKYLYTYYSRSDWDAKLLDKLYEQIIKKVNPDSWTDSMGQTKRKNGA